MVVTWAHSLEHTTKHYTLSEGLKLYIMKAFATATAMLASANTAFGALQQVTGFGSNPTNIQMFISVPAKVATSPAIIVAVSHETLQMQIAELTSQF